MFLALMNNRKSFEKAENWSRVSVCVSVCVCVNVCVCVWAEMLKADALKIHIGIGPAGPP